MFMKIEDVFLSQNKYVIYNAYNKINKADNYASLFSLPNHIFFKLSTFILKPILCSIYFDRKFKGNQGLGETCGVKYFRLKKGRMITFIW